MNFQFKFVLHFISLHHGFSRLVYFSWTWWVFLEKQKTIALTVHLVYAQRGLCCSFSIFIARILTGLVSMWFLQFSFVQILIYMLLLLCLFGVTHAISDNRIALLMSSWWFKTKQLFFNVVICNAICNVP